MRSPIDVLAGKVAGLKKMEIARRTVPCFKHVLEKDGEQLSLCMLVDSGKLYRFPFEAAKASRALTSRPATFAARWNIFVSASSSPDYVAMSKEQTRPSESL